MKFALSTLCENPLRKTGLTSLFHEFVVRGLELYPELEWIVFAGPRQEWTIADPRVEVVRDFPANDRLARRLFADHFLVPGAAARRGADALLTVGFVPLLKRQPGIMHLFSFQHLEGSNRVGGLRSFYRRFIVRSSVERADCIIVNSKFAADQFLRAFPGAKKRLTVSYEGLQHDQFTPESPGGEGEAERARLRAEFGVEPGYLLWVSNFYAYKQADLLLKAFAKLPAAQRAAHPLVMVGGGWLGGIDAARAQTAALGIADEVRFLGWVDDRWLGPLYRQARAFCLASREETFGRCVVEAMASGTPCVVNRIPIMAEVTGGHALVVDFQDTGAVARALTTILTDDAEHDRLRAAGIEWARQFTFEKLTRERIETIRHCLGRV